jgi:CysZ protein
VHQFAIGAGDVGRGLAALRAHPRLWKWLIAPALITLVLLVAAVVAILRLVHPVTSWVSAHLPGALASLAGSLFTVIVIGLLAIGGLLVFTPVAGAIAGPFCERLSEHLESELTGRPPPPFSLREFVHGTALGIAHSLRRIGVALFGVAIVFAVGFVPVIGAVAAVVVAAWFAAKAAAYDCYDAVFGRHLMRYGEKLAYLARHRGRTLGLGLVVAGMLLVPGLNLIALGIGAAGATIAAQSIAAQAAAPAPASARRYS